MNIHISKHIEELRVQRNIKRKALCEGILSDRQYRRYLNGHSSMPNEKVIAFVDRLGIDLFDFYLEFSNKSQLVLNKLKNAFNLINKSKFHEAKYILESIDEYELITDLQRLFFRFCTIMYEVYTDIIPKHIGYERIITLIDYPNIIKRSKINFVELVALESIVSYLIVEKDDKKAVDYLYKILTSSDYEQSGINFMLLPSIYANLSKVLVIQREYYRAIDVIDKGISICKKYEIFNSLSNLYYYKAYVSNALGNQENKNQYINLLKSILLIEGNKEKTAHYLKNIRDKLT